MTLPDMIQAPRTVAIDTTAKVGGAEAGKVVGKGKAEGGGDFAAALADMMGAASTEAVAASDAEAVGTAVPGAEGATAEVMLDDLAQAAALLPTIAAGEMAQAEGSDPGAAVGAEAVPGAAVQAMLAGLGVKATPEGGTETDETAAEGEGTEGEAEAEAEAGTAALLQELMIEPVAALGVAPEAAEVPLAEGEAEAAIGSAVAAAVAGGVVQPMAPRSLRTAPLPGVTETAPQGAATGTEASIQGPEANGPDFAEAEGDKAETGARRNMPLIQQAIVADERGAAKVSSAAEKVAETGATAATAGGAATAAQQASQSLPQSAQAAMQGGPMTGLPGNPAPIAMMRPGWEGAIAERIEAELSGDGQIELDLTPEHLGRLKIRLDMVDGQTMVRFVTETPEAARLIQQNEHRLSESLSRAGLSLGGQETASRDPQGERQARSGGGEGGGMIYERPAEAKVGTMAVPGRAAPGLVNLVA